MNGRTVVSVLMVLVLAGCWTRVDETEHCIETRYGNVVNESMSQGLNFTMLTDAECFTLTDQNYPDDGEVEVVQAVTKAPNPVQIDGDVAIVYAFDPATVLDVFREKRSQRAAEVEIYNSVREGYRNALANWTVADVFSDRRALIGDSVQAHIQRKLGNRAIIKRVFIRNIKLPPEIEAARTSAAQQAQALDKQRQQYQIDSLEAQTRIVRAEAAAREQELLAQAYAESPAVLQLKVAEQMAKICANAQQCILGVSVMDRIMGTGGGQ